MYIYMYIYMCLTVHVAKASDTQAVGHGFYRSSIGYSPARTNKIGLTIFFYSDII